MTKLAWDKAGERLYETGLDKGVLFMPEGSVSWNGLTSIEETADTTSTPLYYDGVKYMDTLSLGDFTGSLNAFTYPEEFSEALGEMSLSNGLSVDNQNIKTFGLSYRTLVGNDLEGTELGYRIHILYNLTAIEDSKAYQTLGDNVDVVDFAWNLTSVPESIEGYRPTAHLIIDSRRIDPQLLENIEALLYGTDIDNPFLPPLEVMATLYTLTIIDNGDGTWAAVGPDSMITMLDSTSFQIDGVEGSYSDATTYTIQSTN